jgi:hypothetical protein
VKDDPTERDVQVQAGVAEGTGAVYDNTQEIVTKDGTRKITVEGRGNLSSESVGNKLTAAARPSARPGPASDRSGRVERYRTAIKALQAGGWARPAVTAKVVLQRLSMSGDDSQLRADVGGWVAFRDAVWREKLG